MNDQMKDKMSTKVRCVACGDLRDSACASSVCEWKPSAVAQSPEPVAWIVQTQNRDGTLSQPYALMGKRNHVLDAHDGPGDAIPLYTHAPPAPSEAECREVCAKICDDLVMYEGEDNVAEMCARRIRAAPSSAPRTDEAVMQALAVAFDEEYGEGTWLDQDWESEHETFEAGFRAALRPGAKGEGS